MAEGIRLTKKSQQQLTESNDYRQFTPNLDDYNTLNDLHRLRLIGTAARVMREHQYFAVADMMRTERWKDISTVKLICYACDTVEIWTEFQENNEIACPYCGAIDEVVTELVPAFNTEQDFKEWITSRLDVGYRTIKYRVEYIDRCMRLGVSREDAFQGLIKWGWNWILLARKVEQRTEQGTLPEKEAVNILSSPESFVDTSHVVRHRKQLEEKDELEQFSIPGTPDFISQLVNPDGKIRQRMYYIGVPVDTDKTELILDEETYWDTPIGQMIAKRQKIETEVTYTSAMELIDYDFYEVWKRRSRVIRRLADVAKYILDNWWNIEKKVDLDRIIRGKTGPIRNLKNILDIITAVTPTNLEPTEKAIEEFDA